MLIDAFLLYAAQSLEGPLREALGERNASALPQWEEGCAQMIVGRDSEGRNTVLIGGIGATEANAIGRAIAKRIASDVTILATTVRTSMVSKKLHMEAGVRRSTARVDGNVVCEVPPPVDSEILEYEDSERRDFPLDPADELIAASEFGSGVLHEARLAAKLEYSGEVHADQSHWSFPKPALEPRLQGLADAINAGAICTSTPQADGRIRLDITQAGAKRIAFVSAAEHAAIKAIVAATSTA